MSYQPPSATPNLPIWGTLDVAPNGTVYVAGTTGPGSGVKVARSANAESAGTPTFTVTAVPGGTIQTAPHRAAVGQVGGGGSVARARGLGLRPVLGQTPTDLMDPAHLQHRRRPT